MGRVGSGTKAGEPKLPVLARRGGKSILHTKISGMESHTGQQDGPCADPAVAVLSHNSFGVAVSPQVGCVDMEKSAWIVLPWGDFVLGSCLWHSGPFPGVAGV